jgi:hypothetical protein
MQISISEEKGRVPVTVFHIEGELSAESYDQLQRHAREAFKAGTHNLLLDLTDVTFLSSSGLRAFHEIFLMLRIDSPEESDESMRAGIKAGVFHSPHLKLLNPSRQVREVLKTAGFDMFLEIHSDRQTALASF